MERVEEQEIVEIFKLRRSPHISWRDIDSYLTETQLKTGVSREILVKTILEFSKTYNYASTIPRIWIEDAVSGTKVSVARDVKREDLLDSYISGCQWQSKLNESISPKQKGTIRICSYNIHYWMDPTANYINIESALEVVDRIEPDIIGFQEALLPYTMDDFSHIDPEAKDSGYNAPIQYTVSTLIADIPKDRRKIESEDLWEMNDIFEMFEQRGYGYRSQCMGSSTHSRGTTYFGNLMVSKILMRRSEGLTLTPSKRRGGGVYGRCATFGHFSSEKSTHFMVCNLHLDVFDETGRTRLKEIKQVIDYLNDKAYLIPTIVVGDFNALKRDDYTSQEKDWLARNNKGHPLDFQTVDLMESSGFQDIFGKGIFKYSSWSARRIDFIFVRNIDLSKIKGSGVMYTPVSDHLPIFVDIDL